MDTPQDIEAFQPSSNDCSLKLLEAFGDFRAEMPLPVGYELDFIYEKLQNLELIDRSIIEHIGANVRRSRAIVQVLLSKPGHAAPGKLPTQVIQWHDEQHQALSNLQAQLKVSRLMLRTTANTLSQTHLSNLSILDLPDEMLTAALADHLEDPQSLAVELHRPNILRIAYLSGSQMDTGTGSF